ncbi:Symplekin tight junction protein C terminal-domain-containing protein [Zopfochytrium polystomum]|nr:Symplekin tight junction protein C terminal-domain-containing protein [Zopfochytrium polystomum]
MSEPDASAAAAAANALIVAVTAAASPAPLSSKRLSSTDVAAIIGQVIEVVRTDSANAPTVVAGTLAPCLTLALADPAPEPRINAVALIEEVVNRVPSLPLDVRISVLQPAMDGLSLIMKDDVLPVLKRAILCATNCYQAVFRLVCTAHRDANVWKTVTNIKERVVKCVEMRNGGIRPHVYKFLQTVALIQSPRDSNPEDPEHDLSLDICPHNHPFLRWDELRSQSADCLALLLAQLRSSTTSGSSITAAVNALFPIAKHRASYSAGIIPPLLAWPRDPPPHLSALEKKSVERTIRTLLLAILGLKAEEIGAFIPQISELLIYLGAKGHEVGNKVSARRKRMLAESASGPAKRARMDDDSMAHMRNAVNSLPVEDVVELIIRTVASTPPHQWQESLLRYGRSLLGPLEAASKLEPAVMPTIVRRSTNRKDPRLALRPEEPPPIALPLFPPVATVPQFPQPPNLIELLAAAGITPEAFATAPLEVQIQFHQLLQQQQQQHQQQFLQLQLALQQQAAANAYAVQPAPVATDSGASTVSLPPPPAVVAKVEEPNLAAMLQEPEFKPSEVSLPVMNVDTAVSMRDAAIERILEVEDLFPLPTTSSTALTAANSTPGAPTQAQNFAGLAPLDPTESMSAARAGWSLVVIRLVRMLDDENEEDVKSDSLGERPPQTAEVLFREKMIEFLLADFPARQEMAILWLYEEFKMDLVRERASNSTGIEKSEEDAPTVKRPFSRRYPYLFGRILRGLKGEAKTESTEMARGLDPKDRTFTKFLIDAPEVLPDAINEVVRSYCDDPDRMQLGLSTLRDLINLRPANRNQCLNILLSYCIHPHRNTRAHSIVIAKRWIGPDHPIIGPVVEAFATSSLLKLLGPPPVGEDVAASSSSEPEDVKAAPAQSAKYKHVMSDSTEMAYDSVFENGGDAAENGLVDEGAGDDGVSSEELAEWKEIDIVRHIELYFALCSKKFELLDLLFQKYGELPRYIAKTVLTHIYHLIKSMSASLERLLVRLRDFPLSAVPLASRIVGILAEKEKPPTGLVAIVMDLFKKKDLDARFVLPVLSSLDKPTVISLIPKILLMLVDGRKELVETTFLRLVEDPMAKVAEASGGVIAAADGTTSGPQLKPTELLFHLHTQEGGLDVIKRCSEGIEICMNQPEIFKQEILAAAIQQLVDQPKISVLLMRTVLRSLKVFPGLSGFVTGMLTRLVSKKIWTMHAWLWEGFIRCCIATVPSSLSVMTSLPKAQLQDMLARAPQLKKRLLQYVHDLPPHMKLRSKYLAWLELPERGGKGEEANRVGGGGPGGGGGGARRPDGGDEGANASSAAVREFERERMMRSGGRA